MPKPNKGNQNNNNNNNNEAGGKNEDGTQEKQEETKGEGQPAITAHFPSEGSEDQTEVDHSKDPDRAAAMLHEIQEEAKLGLESNSEDDIVSDEETKAICALFDVDHINLDWDNLDLIDNDDEESIGNLDSDDLDSIDDDNEESIGGESPLKGYDLLVIDDDIDSIDNNLDLINNDDEESIGGKPQPKEDDPAVKYTTPDLPREVSIPCTYKQEPVTNSPTEIDNSSIGFQFTISETTKILEHFHNKPHLQPEVQAPPTRPYDTNSKTEGPSMNWNSFSSCFGLFRVGWNIFAHCMELFFLSVLIKLLELSIFSVLSVMYSCISLLELVDGFCDALCPLCYYFLHRYTTTVVGLLPDPSISLYG